MRYKLTIEYDGSNYCGMQKQKDSIKKSINGCLEVAIFKLSGEKPQIIACGRTDAGVHALGQVVHFDLNKEFSAFDLASALNHHLKKEKITILNSEIIDENFHARFSAKMRHYKYKIINRRANLALDRNFAHHVINDLDLEKMRQASQYLIGKHDFSAFRDADCQSKSPIKHIEKIEIIQNNQEIEIYISAISFLHHMVRTIVGTLILAGQSKIEPQEMKEILESKNRQKAGPNVPACGLYFLSCDY